MAIERGSINSGVFLTGLCLVPAMLLPYIAGAAQRDLHFDAQQVGLLTAALLGGVIVVMASSVFWVRRIDWRVLVGFGSVLAFIAFAGAAQARSFELLAAMLALSSIGNGVIYAPALCLLGDTPDPDRHFGRAFFLQIVLGGLAGFITTELGQQWGMRGVMLLLAALYLLPLATLPWLPRASTQQNALVSRHATLGAAPMYGGLVGMLLLTIGPTAAWVFFEAIGVAAGFATRSVGNVIAAGLLLGAFGALLSGAAGTKFGRLLPLSAATAGLVVVFATAILTRSLAIYAACAFAFQFLWNFSLSFQYGAVSQADASGRLIVLAPVFQGVGAVLAPAMAGALIHDNDYWSAVVLAAVTAGPGLLLVAWLCSALSKPVLAHVERNITLSP